MYIHKINWRGHEWIAEIKGDRVILTCDDVLDLGTKSFNQISIGHNIFKDILQYIALQESLNFPLSDYSI